MLFLILFLFNIEPIDFSFSYTLNNAHYFATTNRTDTIGADIRKTYFFKNLYYTSFGLAYSYSALDFNLKESNNFNTFKFNTYDFIFEFGKEFRNNIISSTLFAGHSTSTFSNLEYLNYSKKDRGPSYAISLMLGRLIKNNTEAKFGLIYRRLDQSIEYDFFGLMFLLRYRI